MGAMIGSTEMCHRTGATFRQLDYWCRNRVVVPQVEARGSGMHRRFSERQVRVVRLVHGLAALGAKHDVLMKASMSAELIPWDEWFGTVFVDADGDLTSSPPNRVAWSVDLAACANIDEPRQLVLA
jgi:hypothetical protein